MPVITFQRKTPKIGKGVFIAPKEIINSGVANYINLSADYIKAFGT